MPLVHQARLIIGGLNGKSAPAHASRTYALSIGLGGQANRTAQRAAGATNGGGLAAGLMKAVIRSEITPDRAARMAYQTIDPIQPEKLKLIVPSGGKHVGHPYSGGHEYYVAPSIFRGHAPDKCEADKYAYRVCDPHRDKVISHTKDDT